MARRGTELIAHTFAPLTVKETRGEIVVTGTTFAYTFAKASGLLVSLRVLGKEWLARPTPDLWASPEFDPRGQRWEAARETQAEARLVKATPERVTIAARGRYLSARGEALPLRYELTYTVDCDGVVEVSVENVGTGRGAVSWLVFSAATLKRNQVALYSHVGDLAYAEHTGQWVTEELAAGAAGTLLEARFLPWLQVANDAAGLDLVVEEGTELSHGWTDSDPLPLPGDPLGTPGKNFVLEAGRGGISWTYYSIRNLYTPIRKGWRRANRFWLAPTPAKQVNQELTDLRVHWMGPHQYEPVNWPTDEQIASLARRGINVIIGGVNWRSGEYAKPMDPKETRRMIAACHRHGIRIIPYITFTDLEYDTAAYPQHGEEWQIEPVASFRHQTNLMCYGAEGWREYWKRDVDTILERFDFDGLYIDFWVGRMGCRNVKHGCGHKYLRFTLPGLREMAWHSFRRVKEKGADKFVLCNTNLFAGAMINNLVDIRLPGEWSSIEETPLLLARGHLNSRRLGDTALLLRGRDTGLRSVSFSLRMQSPMVMSHGQAPAIAALGPEGAEPGSELLRYADLLRFFGIGKAEVADPWQLDGALEWTGEQGAAYWCRGARGTLLVLANLNGKRGAGKLRVAKPAAVRISPRRRYLVYRPDRNELVHDRPILGSQVREFALTLKPFEPALIYLTESDGEPRPLWATLSDGFTGVSSQAGRLCFTVQGAAGGKSRVTLYLGDKALPACEQSGRNLPLHRRGALATCEVECGKSVEVKWGGK